MTQDASKQGFGDPKSTQEKSPKKNEMFASSPKLQRDLSIKTMQTRATSDTLEGSLMAPPFKFGMQKQYKQLAEMDSRPQDRIRAETQIRG